jgi:hypothetical protein
MKVFSHSRSLTHDSFSEPFLDEAHPFGFGTHINPSYSGFTFFSLTPLPALFRQLLSIIITYYHYFLVVPESVLVIVRRLKEILMNFINRGECALIIPPFISSSSSDPVSWLYSLPITSLVALVCLSLHMSNKSNLISKFNVFYLMFQLLLYCTNNLSRSPWYFTSESSETFDENHLNLNSVVSRDHSKTSDIIDLLNSSKEFSIPHSLSSSSISQINDKVVVGSHTSSFSSGFTNTFTSASSLLSSANFETYQSFFLPNEEDVKIKRRPQKTTVVRSTSFHSNRPSKQLSHGKSSQTTIDLTSLSSPVSPFSSPLFSLSMVTLITTVLVNVMEHGISAVRVFFRYGYKKKKKRLYI